ncbi:hypothetical protein CHLNCDRAFT_28362 [Chlorella variabilis]|uniref:HTH cro/C1-type domain-containing protein n=1 Tax=Chlorella variabilis TaxID=554065 RepID=E1ZSY5_CHLVA|nr:hypothetical protein CHLNCDRAFT_28362 [Chlorella variabilis]EFN51089.1 hypothetical protein CHLNCDRAFT_28362 [Chlorella variabilis]|eukprot:XP_005843191.1 hypothetical protein CHLNCDRAFT_28362 [Chlorella variabilis]
MNLSGNQDWDTVVLSKKRPNAAAAQKPSNVNAAIRAGAQVDTVKKQTGGNASAARGPIKSAAKLENDTETFEHDRVSSELKKQIQQARLAKKLTQAQARGGGGLAQMINEKPQLINEYESGKAIPNPQILSKMSRVLGVTLKKNPGKK